MNQFQDAGRSLDEAVELTMLICTEQDILTDFLKQHGVEVMNMLDWSFEKVLKAREKESREDGENKKAIEMAKKLIARNSTIDDIVDLTGLSVKEVKILISTTET